MAPQLTVTESDACAEPSLEVVTCAVLSIVAQLAFVVLEVMCTFLLAPEASVPKLHVSTPPLIEQPPSEFAASIDHDRPACVGNVSVTVTPRVSPAPALVAVMTKPIVSPALTVAW